MVLPISFVGHEHKTNHAIIDDTAYHLTK